ncbi:uncharacterized protein Z520_04721 [Fonsecaea multimorphosa CBS 102226]|uniref:Metaxin glutathione S-transferase domain-containing protein n=1 Tax=Fonsecaea multimorphosa CBS 102226 TaxID=1442371 RepID=A0A0D2HB67_9EURO|nr:uncharacterized protein Z520_04721 [Fonsecaea multimorphosa CBS 102226]KIX99145.1 hypothetical protein Z520_04721 [Fonsecaea multimorphosa CBS 102226]
MGVDMTDNDNKDKKVPRSPAQKSTPSSPSFWSLPLPLRRIFDQFPLVTYPANALPQRVPRLRHENILCIFQSDEPASRDGPSFNPSCLKWQAYLKFRGIPLRTRSSNNHASPTGALPFLLPASRDASRPASPVPANRIVKWVISQGGKEEAVHSRQDAYTALIDHAIRSAWLYYLYLDEDNFQAVAWPLYVASASSSSPVRLSLAHQLQAAAREELLKINTVIDPQQLYSQAEQAFRSLSVLLADDQFFFGQSTPGLFDASLFAYTQIILDNHLFFETRTLNSSLKKYHNLVEHRNRLLRGFFSG